MNRQDLFDKYIAGELSEAEELSFTEELKSDKSLAEDFQIYLNMISTVIKEEEQDCIDFAASMRNLNNEKLNEILGKKPAPRKISLMPILTSIMSVAAVVAVIVTFSYKMERDNTRYMAYNIIVENKYVPLEYRGGEDIDFFEDITEVTEEDLQSQLPLYKEAYKQAETDQDRQTYGMNLAMVYLKLHQVDSAVKILQELYDKYIKSEDEHDVDFAHECLKVICQLEKL